MAIFTIYTKFRNYEESILKLRIVSRNLISHYITIQKATLFPLVAGEMSQVTRKHNLPYLSVEDLGVIAGHFVHESGSLQLHLNLFYHF